MFHRTLLDMPDTSTSFCSTPPQTTPYSLLTGIRRTPCATTPSGMFIGHLAESSPRTSYEPKSCIDVSSEHTLINHSSERNRLNIENDLTTTVAASENSDGFHQQATASGSPQPVPASAVNPWLRADMWSSTGKSVRSGRRVDSPSSPRKSGTTHTQVEVASVEQTTKTLNVGQSRVRLVTSLGHQALSQRHPVGGARAAHPLGPHSSGAGCAEDVAVALSQLGSACKLSVAVRET